MKSSRRDRSTPPTGTHRAHSVRQPPHAQHAQHAQPGRHAQPVRTAQPADRYGPYLDGLFTYCLSVMCDHDAATAALGEALAVAERQFDRGREPSGPGRHRPWLYALSRWACLRRLAEHSTDRTGTLRLSAAAATQRHRELAALAWPEAAGIAPEQREALELAVRHDLSVAELAAVLALSAEAAGELLTSAACEVERTRAALAVVESGGCPAVARLSGGDRPHLGHALRRELLRHVDDCAECRRGAERAMAGVSWPGTAPGGTAPLTVLQAPRPAVHAAQRAAQRARSPHSPRFARSGFPVDPGDRAARRDRLRSRAVTTTVVATVVAAPVLALWAAYRGAPHTGEAQQATPVSAADRDDSIPDGRAYANAGRSGRGASPDNRYGPRSSGLSVAVEGSGSPAIPGRPGTGVLEVRARHTGSGAVITLTASGRSAVHWSASTGAAWVSLSRTSGTLRPGGSVSFMAYVNKAAEPSMWWAARIRIAPSGAVITLEGRGDGAPQGHPDAPAPGPAGPGSGPDPVPSHSSDPGPGSGPDPGPDPDPSSDPTQPPDPTPSPSDPGPTDPGNPGGPSDPAPSTPAG